MRIERLVIGDIVHVYNCGNRKMEIVTDEEDRWRFIGILRYFNDRNSSLNIFREIYSEKILLRSSLNKTVRLPWPSGWPKQEPLVEILGYALMPNHYHLILREIRLGGISLFMQKLGIGLTSYTNIKYGESGKIFQGSYKAKKITNEKYLQYVDVYVQVLNPLELVGENEKRADMVKAFKTVIASPFSSLGESLGQRNLDIIDRKLLHAKYNLPATEAEYLALFNDVLLVGGLKKVLGDLAFD